MKTLFIMRHAKSSWDNAVLSDFERPLNERGLQAAPLIGSVMQKNDFKPALILSSPATRAVQTAQLVKETANIKSEIRFDRRIYEATPAQLLKIIVEQADEIESLMLVGHNPGFEGLVRVLTGKLEPMPTAALAVIDLKIDRWNELTASAANLRTLIRPKEIK